MPEFEEPTEDSSIEARQGKKIALDANRLPIEIKGSMLDHLKKGNTIAGFSREDLIGVCSIYMGWANDPAISHQLHDLLLYRSDSLPQTQGDAFLLLATNEILPAIEPPQEFGEENLQLWMEVARGKNPIYRQIALEVFPKITNRPGYLFKFLSAYYSETDHALRTK